jgi:hypothetical protein
MQIFGPPLYVFTIIIYYTTTRYDKVNWGPFQIQFNVGLNPLRTSIRIQNSELRITCLN